MHGETNAPALSIKETDLATEAMLRRIQGEFFEMPGLRLTAAQARRLWGLDAPTCSALLDALIAARFLFRTSDGAFMRIEEQIPLKVRPSLRTSGRTAA